MTAHPPRHVAVIDIGKTNAKLALVDLAARTEVTALRRPNTIRNDGPYPHYDIDALWTFILDGLATLAREHAVDAISVTTHGATAALIDADGELVLPVLDYEYDGPDRLRNEYEAVRPPFAETGSPALPIGLNLGAQLFWLQDELRSDFARTAAILTWPQYWSWRLTGAMASEATSLGCHTDLWNPHKRDFSTLVDVMGWRGLFPPLRPANAVLGPVLYDIARKTGLSPHTPVINGIHDSNASLLPHLVDRAPPFAVVSTGTWVIVMSIGGREVTLDPARDTLINVDAFGNSIPSARFMGGREFEILLEGQQRPSDASDVASILEGGTMLLPSVVGGAGPFPSRGAQWVGHEPRGGQRHAAVSFYLALMTATCLDLVGAQGPVVVEGPFGSNELFLSMLEAATGRQVTAGGTGSTGTSIGAALLTSGARSGEPETRSSSRDVPEGFRLYAAAWRSKVAAAD